MTPADVQSVAEPVLAHRLVVDAAAALGGVDASAIVARSSGRSRCPYDPAHEILTGSPVTGLVRAADGSGWRSVITVGILAVLVAAAGWRLGATEQGSRPALPSPRRSGIGGRIAGVEEYVLFAVALGVLLAAGPIVLWHRAERAVGDASDRAAPLLARDPGRWRRRGFP